MTVLPERALCTTYVRRVELYHDGALLKGFLAGVCVMSYVVR